jgi:hypothetical protein
MAPCRRRFAGTSVDLARAHSPLGNSEAGSANCWTPCFSLPRVSVFPCEVRSAGNKVIGCADVVFLLILFSPFLLHSRQLDMTLLLASGAVKI